ncbi:MAG: RHS repeat protein [Phycisphaerae bacterium]
MTPKILATLSLLMGLGAGVALAATIFEYDAHHRLTNVTFDNGAQITYEYDASGNRTARTHVSPVS